MKAMILAAGLRTRLRPLTNNKPKALVSVNGVPMLEILINRLISYGFKDIVINVHHFAELIIDFLNKNKSFGINIHISEEDEILNTGGGIKQARIFLEGEQPFLVHNVDIFSNINLVELFQYHQNQQHLATLAVMQRHTKRYLMIDENNQLCGHWNKISNEKRILQNTTEKLQPMAFSGIHVMSPQIFQYIIETGSFSVIDMYLRLVAEGHQIGIFQMDHYYWRDLGRPENIKAVEQDIIDRKIKI